MEPLHALRHTCAHPTTAALTHPTAMALYGHFSYLPPGPSVMPTSRSSEAVGCARAPPQNAQKHRNHRGRTTRRSVRIDSASAARAAAAEPVAHTNTTAKPATTGKPATRSTAVSTAIAAASVASAAAKLLHSSNELLASSWQANDGMLLQIKQHAPDYCKHVERR